jgi:hypothetical protein
MASFGTSFFATVEHKPGRHIGRSPAATNYLMIATSSLMPSTVFTFPISLTVFSFQ